MLSPNDTSTTELSHELEWNGSQNLGLIVLGGDQVSVLGGEGESLASASNGAGGLSLGLLDLVGVDSVQEILPALAMLDVLNADADPLGENVSTDTLVHDNSDGTLGDVEDTTSLSVVSLMGHTLLEGTAAYTDYNI